MGFGSGVDTAGALAVVLALGAGSTGAVACRDPRAFLATVLERVQTVERETGDIFAGGIHPKHATGFFRIVVFGDHYSGVALLQ